MNETPNVASMVSYIKTLKDGVSYAKEHDEVFEFLIAMTVIVSKLMTEHPEESARLTTAVEEVKKVFREHAVH